MNGEGVMPDKQRELGTCDVQVGYIPGSAPHPENDDCKNWKPLVKAAAPVQPVPPIDPCTAKLNAAWKTEHPDAITLTPQIEAYAEYYHQAKLKARTSSPAVAPAQQVVCHKCGESFIFKRDGDRLLAFVRGHSCAALAVAGTSSNDPLPAITKVMGEDGEDGKSAVVGRTQGDATLRVWPTEQEGIALEKEWMGQSTFQAYTNWLKAELLVARKELAALRESAREAPSKEQV